MKRIEHIRNAMSVALSHFAKAYKIANEKINMTREMSGKDTPVELSYEMKELLRYAPLYGFSPELGGAIITYGSKNYQVMGIRRAHFVLKSMTDNQTYHAKVSLILENLKRKKSEYILPKNKLKK